MTKDPYADRIEIERPAATVRAELLQAAAEEAAEAPESAPAGIVDINSPVGQAMLQSAVAKAVTAALAAQGGQGGDADFATKFADAILSLNNDGGSQWRKHRPVPPDVMRQRGAARKRMFALIREADEAQDEPKYVLVDKTHLVDQLIEPMSSGLDKAPVSVEIGWYGVPNGAMRPTNETATAIFEAFVDSVGSMIKARPDPETSVTVGGITINGVLSSRRGADVSEAADTAARGGLRINGRSTKQRLKEVRILGTVVEPARQLA